MSALINPGTETIEICVLCGHEASEKLMDCQDRQHRLPGSFMLVQCSDCGLVRLSPRPRLKDLPGYYPEEAYFSYQEPATSILKIRNRGWLGSARESVRTAALRSLGYPVRYSASWQSAIGPLAALALRDRALYGLSNRFPPYFPNGRALDVGCGNGYYLSYLKHHGWEVDGIEISLRAARSAKEQFDIDVFVGDLDDAPFSSACFDFIHLCHVIEHLPEPIQSLKLISTWLKPGGIVYIETPNADSDGLKKTGSYWFPLDSPRHVYLFSWNTLQRTFALVGLDATKVWTSAFPGVYSWEDTYRREERLGEFIGDRISLPFARIPRAVIGSGLSRIKRLVDRFNGDILHVWAKKN